MKDLEYILNIPDTQYIETIEEGRKYKVVVPVGVRVNGKKTRRVVRVNGSLTTAISIRNGILEEVYGQPNNVEKNMTFGELCDYFLEKNEATYIFENGKNIKNGRLSYGSMKTYKTYIKNYLKPTIRTH